MKLKFSLATVLALALLAGVSQVWELMGVRTRPWHFEAHLMSSLAECRIGPGAFSFRREYDSLESRAQEADGLLRQIDSRWWPRRDYGVCLSRLLAIDLDARLLKLKMRQREMEQREKARVFILLLGQELGSGNGNGKIWSRFDLRSIEQNRARSLMAQAQYLNAQGEFESALSAALRASASWQRYNRSSDLEFSRFEDPNLISQWNQQAEELLRWTKGSGRCAILVDKLGHRCFLLSQGRVEKSYVANLGRSWYRRKIQEQDASTPEGEYRVKRMNPAGRFGRALLLDYPNSADRARFAAQKREGTISGSARIGGNIEIHGAGRPDVDWTDGCISLANADMRELYRRAAPGMRVTIVGTSRLSPEVRGESSAAR